MITKTHENFDQRRTFLCISILLTLLSWQRLGPNADIILTILHHTSTKPRSRIAAINSTKYSYCTTANAAHIAKN
jgi:hypothetical protein